MVRKPRWAKAGYRLCTCRAYRSHGLLLDFFLQGLHGRRAKLTPRGARRMLAAKLQRRDGGPSQWVYLHRLWAITATAFYFRAFEN